MANYDGYTPTMTSSLPISSLRDHGLPALKQSVEVFENDVQSGGGGVLTVTNFNATNSLVADNTGVSGGYATLTLDSTKAIPSSSKMQVPNVNQLFCVYLAPYMFKPIAGSEIYKLNSLSFRLPVANGIPIGKSSAMIKQ